MDEKQRKALEEGKLVPIRVRVDLSRCGVDPAALAGLPGGGEARAGDGDGPADGT